MALVTLGRAVPWRCRSLGTGRCVYDLDRVASVPLGRARDVWRDCTSFKVRGGAFGLGSAGWRTPCIPSSAFGAWRTELCIISDSGSTVDSLVR